MSLNQTPPESSLDTWLDNKNPYESPNLSRVPSAIAHPEIKQTEVEEKGNLVLVIQGKVALEAIEDQIIVLLDKFKSGYECKDCDETGIITQCSCRKGGHPGENRLGGVCKQCGGDPSSVENKQCRACKGSGQTIIIPESTKGMPTSGRIVSTGPECTKRNWGERVIFGAHIGYFIPFKGNVRLRIMRETEPLCLVHSVDENLTMDEFMVFEEPIDNKSPVR